MPVVTQVIGVKTTGVKNNRPWAITSLRVDSGQLAETFDQVAIGDSGELTFNDKYQTYSFKKDKAGSPGAAPTISPATNGTRNPAPPAYKDEAAIKAMWAIGQAVSAVGRANLPVTPGDGTSLITVETLADELFAMVNRVKQGGQALQDADLPPVEVYDNLPAEIQDDL